MAAEQLRLVVCADAEAAAVRGAEIIADALRSGIDARGRASLALSGGSTPQRMLERLAEQDLQWQHIHVFQVDERVAPQGHSDRNAVSLSRAFARRIASHPEQFHWMPVEAVNLASAADQYAALLADIVGPGSKLDAVHLGMGGDGHTASLFPGSPLLDEKARAVAVAPPHQGRERMTLTFPVINHARSILWLVTGADKRGVLAQLLSGDAALVASRVRRDVAVVVADVEAAVTTR